MKSYPSDRVGTFVDVLAEVIFGDPDEVFEGPELHRAGYWLEAMLVEPVGPPDHAASSGHNGR